MIINYKNEMVHIKDALTNITFESIEFDKFINYFDNYLINYYGRININTIDENDINEVLILNKDDFSYFILKYINLNYENFKNLNDLVINNLNDKVKDKYDILKNANNFNLI